MLVWESLRGAHGESVRDDAMMEAGRRALEQHSASMTTAPLINLVATLRAKCTS